VFGHRGCLAAGGHPLSVVVVVGGIRAMLVARRRQQAGRPLDFGAKLAIVLVSWLIAFCVAMAMLMAFVATCFPLGAAIFDTRYGLAIASAVGTVVAVAVAVAAGLFWLTRKVSC
jgi:hypothetical protein